MPPKTKRQKSAQENTRKVRAKKRRLEVDESASVGPGDSDGVTGLCELLDTDDEDVDPSSDLDSSINDDVEHLWEVKAYKKAIISHRKISEIQ